MDSGRVIRRCWVAVPAPGGSPVLGQVLAEPVQAPLDETARRSDIQRSADRRVTGLRLQVRVRPSFCVRTRPLVSRICTCCTTAASDMDSGLPSSLTEAGPSAEPLEHEPAPGVGERMEDAIQIRHIVKHMLEYRPADIDSQAVT